MIIQPNSVFYLELRRNAARYTQMFIDAGLYDFEREGPHASAIETLFASGQPVDPMVLWLFEQFPAGAGSAFQALGEPEIARLWYHAGQYGWLGGAHWYTGDISELDEARRESPAFHQLEAGICAALAGNPSRAGQLFAWAARNWEKTDQEVAFYEKTRQFQAIWESMGYQLFALMWIGERWDEIQRLAEIGWTAVEKTRRTGQGRPQLLIEIARSLSAYFLNSNENTRQAAVDALRVDKIRNHDPHARSGWLPYLFALGQRYPQINPYPESDFNHHLWRPSNSQRDPLPTRSEFQAALNGVLLQAQKKNKAGVVVSSIDLHLQVGGYPGREHRMDLCCQVMREAMLQRDRITSQVLPPYPPLLEVVYELPRPWLDQAYPVEHRN
jgi:5-methylcytosine-specific restriction protein A